MEGGFRLLTGFPHTLFPGADEIINKNDLRKSERNLNMLFFGGLTGNSARCPRRPGILTT